MLVVIIVLTAITLGCLFSENVRIFFFKILIEILKFFAGFFLKLGEGMVVGSIKSFRSAAFFTLLLSVGGISAIPVIDYKLSDIGAQDVRYVENYWDVFHRVGKEKDINPLFLLSIVKIEGGVRDGELVNPGNGQGIGQLYSWVVVAKRYYFPPGPVSDAEAEEQIELIADFITGKCSGLSIGYDSMSDVSDEVLWDRVACFERYNGVRGGTRGDMSSYPAVFNNLPGYPELQGMLIPDGDLSSNLVPMQQDGYEVTYRKFATYLSGQEADSSSTRRASIPWAELFPSNEVGDLSAIEDFTPVGYIPYALNTHDCSSYVDPGVWGPQVDPILESGWYITSGCHEALAVDVSRSGGQATLVSPIRGYVTAVYNDGYCGKYGCNNPVVVIENSEWLVAFLHQKSLSVNIGMEVSVEDVIGQMGSKGNSSGPHLHYIVFNKSQNTFVYAGNYLD